MIAKLLTARSVSRSWGGVRGSKTSMDLQEQGDKRSLHRKVLDRFRAEYKIRKTRRLLQRAVTFVPNMILGWLKAVRACLNLKFLRGPANPSLAEELSDGGSALTGSASPNLGTTKDFDPPYPFWWAWKRLTDCGHVALFWRQEPVLTALGGVWHPSLAGLSRSATMGGSSADPEDLDLAWEKPTALGGPNWKLEPVPVGECGHDCKFRKLGPIKFRWAISEMDDVDEPLVPTQWSDDGRGKTLESVTNQRAANDLFHFESYSGYSAFEGTEGESSSSFLYPGSTL